MNSKTISIEKAMEKFSELFQQTLESKSETIITSEEGDLVLINQQSLEELKATVQLLKDSVSLKGLLEGHIARKKNKVKGKSIDKVFNDL